MPKELLQMNQLQEFYNSITSNGVKIRAMSKSDNYMSFEVKGSHESAVKSFSIGYYDNEGSLSAVENYRDMISLGSYGWVKREDGSYHKQSMGLCFFKLGSEGYKLLTDLFNNLKKLNFSTYYGKEFCDKTFSPFIKAIRNLNNQRTIEGISAITSTTTELSNFSQLEESTEEVDYEAQEGSEYFAVEPAPLKQQEFYFTSNETTEEINYIMKEIKSSNASNGITTKNIKYVQDMTSKDVAFSPSKVALKNVPALPELNSTNATLPQLPNESGIIGTTTAGLSTLSAYIVAPVLLLAAVTVGGCWFFRKKKREDSYDVEKAGVENEVEAPFSEEQNSLLDEINIKLGVYKSFQRNVD